MVSPPSSLASLARSAVVSVPGLLGAGVDLVRTVAYWAAHVLAALAIIVLFAILNLSRFL